MSVVFEVASSSIEDISREEINIYRDYAFSLPTWGHQTSKVEFFWMDWGGGEYYWLFYQEISK